MTRTPVVLLLTLTFIAGCMMSAREEAPSISEEVGSMDDGFAMAGGAAAPAAAPAEPEPEAAKSELAPTARGEGRARDGKDTAPKAPGSPPPPPPADDGPRTRAWFPDTFLWRPLVETDPTGHATVTVTVPDTLTSWRVLALASARDGQQAGTTHTFDGRLDAWVDAPTPGWLYRGDVLDLPVQAFAGAGPRTGALTVSGTGALSGNGGGSVAVAAGGSASRVVTLTANGVGPATIEAAFGGSDTMIRALEVRPVGRPVVTETSGSLATTRTLTLTAPPGADPASDRLDVVVFPGALAVVTGELDRPPDAHPPGYGFALVAQARALSVAAGAPTDADALRRQQILAWQRVSRASRNPDPATTSALLLALRDPGDHELAAAAIPRFARVLRDDQNGDGSWSWWGTSLDAVRLQTAVAGLALPASEVSARTRASGALERFSRDVEDPFVAAVMIASGLLDGDTVSRLAPVFHEGLSQSDQGVVFEHETRTDPWGAPVSKAQALAWATLAASRSPGQIPAADLATALMGTWSAQEGFGAGSAGPIVLEALATALPALSRPVTVTLRSDASDEPLATTRIDVGQPLVPAVLSVPARGDTWTLEVAPALPGLAWVASRSSWVPWSGDERAPGVDLEVVVDGLRVGQDGQVTLRVAAPSATPVQVALGVPPGAAVDLAALQGAAGVVSAAWLGDRVSIGLGAMGSGEITTIAVPIRLTYAGTFTPPPTVIRAGGSASALPPPTWSVR